MVNKVVTNKTSTQQMTTSRCVSARLLLLLP